MDTRQVSVKPTGEPEKPLDLYPMRKNRLRELLDAGLPSLGTHLMSTWPTVTELVGQTGQFDYIEFVAEYAPWTMHDLDNLGRAIELFPDFSGMVKIEQFTRGHLAMRAIGSGLQNVLFADVGPWRTPYYASARCGPSTPNIWGATAWGCAATRGSCSTSGRSEWVATLAGLRWSH